MTSADVLIAAMISSCAGTLALCLRYILHSAIPCSFLRMSPIFSSSLSELNFVFSTSATFFPASAFGRAMAEQWGVPQYRYLAMPHPIANLTDAELDRRAREIVPEVVKLLLQGQE